MIEHPLPCFRDRHAATVPLEKGNAELLLQEPDLAAERRLHDVQPIRGLTYAAEFGNMNQGYELRNLHRSPHCTAADRSGDQF